MSRRVVCLGEALVDLVCAEPVAGLGETRSFVPHPGGSLANIAVAAARFGARVEMLGGAGGDEWGRWLRDRLAAEGVGVERFALGPGWTSHAFVTVGHDGEPSFAFYGDDRRPAAEAATELDSALAAGPGVLVLGSDTLLGKREREVTMRAAQLARERGWHVLCDPNLRPPRWPDEATMLATIRELVAAADVVKCNEGEALALAGAGDLAAAHAGLLALGPRAAAVTRGRRGALLVTPAGESEVPAGAAALVDATGAGDCVAGVLAAALAQGTEPESLAPALRVAMDAAAGVVSAWGATAGLPEAAAARAALAAAG